MINIQKNIINESFINEKDENDKDDDKNKFNKPLKGRLKELIDNLPINDKSKN